MIQLKKPKTKEQTMAIYIPWTYKMTGIELECTMDSLKNILGSYFRIAREANIFNEVIHDPIYEELENFEFRIMDEKDKTMQDWENEINIVSAKLADKYKIHKFLF